MLKRDVRLTTGRSSRRPRDKFWDSQNLSPFSVSSTTGTTPIRDRVGQFQVAESVITTIATALLEGHTVRLCFSFFTVTSIYRFFVADDVQSSGFPGHGDEKSVDVGFAQNQPPTGAKTPRTVEIVLFSDFRACCIIIQASSVNYYFTTFDDGPQQPNIWLQQERTVNAISLALYFPRNSR
jgi:hypothetical protein